MSSEAEALPDGAVDVVVRLLFELGEPDADAAPPEDRICEAMCRLTSLERAVLHEPVEWVQSALRRHLDGVP